MGMLNHLGDGVSLVCAETSPDKAVAARTGGGAALTSLGQTPVAWRAVSACPPPLPPAQPSLPTLLPFPQGFERRHESFGAAK